MWEPVAGEVLDGIEFHSPNMIMGTKLGGRCVVDAINHVTHFEHWTCPKILMEVEVSAAKTPTKITMAYFTYLK